MSFNLSPKTSHLWALILRGALYSSIGFLSAYVASKSLIGSLLAGLIALSGFVDKTSGQSPSTATLPVTPTETVTLTPTNEQATHP